MATLSNIAPIVLPYYQFNKVDGTAFFNAKIYIGEPDLNPETNPIVVNAVQEDNSLTPLTQPLRTNTTGYIIDDVGVLAFAVVDQDYSIAVYDQNDVLIYEESLVPANTTGEIINLTPEMFGALGCPEDDTDAFDQAIAAQQASGLIIELQRPCYKADINVLSTQDIKMYSKGISTIKPINVTQWSGVNDVILNNVIFDFVDLADGLNGLEITSANSIRIKESQFNNAPRTNFVLFDCNNFIVSNNEFNGAGRENYVNPGSGVNIGCGLIAQDCKQDSNQPLIIKGNSSAQPWQIGFFVVNEGVGTETYGVVIKDNYVYGAQDNGIRTQTQGTPFDPLRCRDHVVQGNYVVNSSIDNYRANGQNNSFANNHSVTATGYGMKSDGGTNINMSNNHDNGSAVAVGMRMGADTINYSVNNNVSINCSGSAAAFYGVLAENAITVKNISMSGNAAFDLGDNSTAFGIVAVSGITSKVTYAQINDNFCAETPKQCADFKQVDQWSLTGNCFFSPGMVASTLYCCEINDCTFGNISANTLTPRLGVTDNSFRFTSGSVDNFGVGNYQYAFNLNASWLDFTTGANFLQDSRTVFNGSTLDFQTDNTVNLGSALSRTIDVDDVINAATGQDAAKLVLGFLTQFVADKQDFRLQSYTGYINN